MQLFALCLRTVEARVRGARGGARVRFGSGRCRRSMTRVLLEIEIEHLVKHGKCARSETRGVCVGGGGCAAYGAVWDLNCSAELAESDDAQAAALPQPAQHCQRTRTRTLSHRIS